ncbi:hypothetical protein ACQ5TV_05735 [Acetobacter ghanensis]|uniref:hypothetical protein n=1 Tax=Acetobacter ghanensis TaxID=431306 RepID=UPI003D32FA6F
MKKATTTHNPDRVIAHSLDGPVYAPDDWSDEQVLAIRARTSSFCVPTQCAHQRGCSARGLPSTGLHRQSAMAHQYSLEPSECHWPNELLFAPQASRCCAYRPLAKLLPTKRLGKNFSYRISMVVVAIAMVVLLRVLVNQRSQHGGAA